MNAFRSDGIRSNPDDKGNKIDQQKGQRSAERGNEIGYPLPTGKMLFGRIIGIATHPGAQKRIGVFEATP